MSFAKLDSGITKSSIWSEPLHVRVVWIAFLAEKDENGFVAASRSGMIRVCNVTPEEFDSAASVLEAPDPESRTPDYDGRRIAKIEGGWIVLNHEKYRLPEKEKNDKRKEYMRDYMNKYRKNKPCKHLQEFTPINSTLTSVSVSESVSDLKEGECEGETLHWLLACWQEADGTTHHRTITPDMQRVAREVAGKYPREDLEECVSNYAAIMSSPDDYFGKYPHGFNDFFRAGAKKPPPFEKFLPERNPLTALKNRPMTGGKRSIF